MMLFIRKKIVVMAISCLLIGSISNVMAFGLPDVGALTGSSSSDVNWGDLAGKGEGAEKNIYAGTKLLGLSTITMAEALGYKKEAASLRAQVKSISEDGSISGDFDLGETAKLSESVFERLGADEKALTSLGAEQKDALSKSVGQYIAGSVLYIKGLKDIGDIASKASGAPITEVTKFVGIIKLAPVAATGAKDFFGKLPQVIKMMRVADIAMPSNINDIPGASDF